MQAQFLPNVNPANPGKMVDFIRDKEVLSQYPDQFSPYTAFGHRWDRPFQGTLFRFPLRTEEQARESMLSKRAISEANAADLLESLKMEASAMLLFLKTVEIIEIFDWPRGAAVPSAVFSATISSVSAELRRQRAFVGDAIRASNASLGGRVQGQSQPSVVDYTLCIRCENGLRSDPDEGKGELSYVETWEVCNQLGGVRADTIACDAENSMLRLVPWGGVAAKVSPSAPDASLPTGSGGGLAYCFLPLPVRTGLPVMVNGFFELSSNRRDVWQAGVDMTGDGRTRAAWNIALMTDVISPCYMRVLKRLRSSLGFSSSYQMMWPNLAAQQPWTEVTNSTLSLCRMERLLYKDSITRNRPIPLSVSGNQAGPDSDPRWIRCADAVILPQGKQVLTESDESILRELLLLSECEYVDCFVSLREILAASSTVGYVSNPSFVRNLLRRSGNTSKPAFVPSKPMCTFLMRYCTVDIMWSTFSSVKELDGLPILPLSVPDEKVLTSTAPTVGLLHIYNTENVNALVNLTGMGFSLSASLNALSLNQFRVDPAMEALMELNSGAGQRRDGHQLFVMFVDPEELKVFSSAAGIVLDRACINATEIDILMHKSIQEGSNIRVFEPKLVPDLLRRVIPPECFAGSGYLDMSSVSTGISQGLISFLMVFWTFCSTRPDVVTALVEGPAIVPTMSGKLLPLSRLSNLLSADNAGSAKQPLPESVRESLQILGVNIVDHQIIPTTGSVSKVFWDYVHPPTRSGILAVLKGVLRLGTSQQNKQNIETHFLKLNSVQRMDLLDYLACCEPVKSISGKLL